MKKVDDVSEIINNKLIPPGSVMYTAGNAATPQVLLKQLGDDHSIAHVALYSVLLLGDQIDSLFTEQRCKELTHRVIFNSHLTRGPVNKGWAKYHPMHLSEIPKYARLSEGFDVVLLSVSGPDISGRYSLGTTVEGLMAAIRSARDKGGIVIAERNMQMPFVLGTTISADEIDYIIDSNYDLPTSPVKPPDDVAQKIGDIIASLYIQDGSGKIPGSTLQYGIGEVPEAVTNAIIKRGIKDLGIHTELFAGAMRRLVENNAVSNKWKKSVNFAISSIFLAENQQGYDWLNYNSAVQSRPCDYTNSVFRIAAQPKMVSINSAIGIDLHGNIWADSLDARKIYSGVGGQADFLRGAQISDDGLAIIALKSTTSKGISKIVNRSPAGITTTAIASDQVIIVTENGAFDPRRLSLGERAVGIAHLAAPEKRDEFLKLIHDDGAFHKPKWNTKTVPGFISYEEAMNR